MRAKTDKRKETMLKIPQFSPGEVAFVLRFFPTHSNLIRKSRTLRKRTRSDVTCNSRITDFFTGQAGISIRKQPSDIGKTPRRPLFAGPYLSSPSSTSRKVHNFRKESIVSFPGTPRTSKTDVRSYVNHARKN